MIKIIRGITVVLMFVTFELGALFIRYLIFPFQKSKIKNYETLQKSWQFYIQLLKISRVIKLSTNDIEKISEIKNSIIVSTHPSLLDIVILMSIIPHSTCFVAPKLARNPFFKGMVNLLFVVENPDMNKWLDNACQKLHNGMNIIIFPMGTRHKKGEYLKIRRGAALIAQKSHKNIVMLNIDTDFGFLQGNEPIYKAGDKPVLYTLEYLGIIDINSALEKYKDKVTFNTEITRQISKNLYKR